MTPKIVYFSFLLVYFSLSSSNGKYVEGEINTLEDWHFITRFCFLSAKGTLKFTFEYPVSYGPQHILLYFDTPDQWDSVYKSDKNCHEKLAVLDVSNNQIINLTTAYGMSGCVIRSDGMYECIGGRIFRSFRERWWFVAVSRCDRDPADCKGGRYFRAARERWWYVAVSGCEKNPGDNCTEREAVLKPENKQKLRLLPNTDNTGCIQTTLDGEAMYLCSNTRTFRSARERWWYIAVSHCQPKTPVGISLKYKIHMTNGQIDDYLHREYSADEFYILPIDIAFLIAYVILCILSIICAVILRNRQLWHTTYKMYMVSVGLWTMYLFLMSVGYGIYGNDGLEYKLRSTKYAARTCESISIMVFLLMLILIGKGYTITRGKLSMSSTIKISVFMTLYVITYIVIFIWEAIIFDPGLVLYLYESPPGYALIAMRIIGYMWFCYAIFFTLKHYPEKGKFYYPLFVFYTLWFWAGPIVIVIAMFAVALWSREKSVVGVENFVALCGHVFFMILTRPSAANKNFPYHVRTTQIGILENAPHTTGEGMNGDIGGQAYAVSGPMQGSSSGPDLTSLFVTSQTKSNEKQHEAETSMVSNGMSNGISNGSTTPPPQYNSFPMPTSTIPSAPPRYETMFQARKSIDEEP
ncbi:hypothetical protein ACF0H5_011482 [Mactra antiquata]